MNFVTQPNFIDKNDVSIIESFDKPVLEEIQNYHIKHVSDGVKGWSTMFDFSKTSLTKELTKLQGDGTLIKEVPDYYKHLGVRIAEFVGISSENMYFQYIVIGANGEIRKHYDVGKPGYITYKCNICVSGPDNDVIYVGNADKLEISPLSLYCFEANLYKHWMNSCDIPRVHLSYGFILPYSDLGWDENCLRVRLSNKIWNMYMKNM